MYNFVEGDFLNAPPPSVPKLKMPWCQPELPFHEILHLKEPLVLFSDPSLIIALPCHSVLVVRLDGCYPVV